MQNFELFGCEACKQIDCLINKYCTQKWKTFLGHNKHFEEFPKKLNVFSEGGTVSRIYFIRYGKIKVFNTSNSGKQNITRLVGSGEMLTLRSFADNTYFVSATTLEPTSICSFEKNIFTKVIKKNPTFSWQLMEFYAHQFSKIENHNRNLTQVNAKRKVAEALLIVKNKFGLPLGKNECLLDVVISRQEIADIAGTCLAESIRTLSILKRERIIRIRDQKIVIADEKKLQQFILEKYSDRRKTV